jgi:hypothetical protein
MRTLSYLANLELSVYDEMLQVAQYAVLANPYNLRPLQLQSLLFYVPTTVIVQVVIFTILVLAPLLILWATVLSSCTFRYQERIQCATISRCIGRSLRCYMIVIATMCWGTFIYIYLLWIYISLIFY